MSGRVNTHKVINTINIELSTIYSEFFEDIHSYIMEYFGECLEILDDEKVVYEVEIKEWCELGAVDHLRNLIRIWKVEVDGRNAIFKRDEALSGN